MTLARLVLESGRDVALSHLYLESTYGGLLEGYPSARINDWLLGALPDRAARRLPGAPVHLVEPVRTRPAEKEPGRRPFGPAELLPAVLCVGRFDSHPVNPGVDPAWHESRLVIAWFQDDPAVPASGPAPAPLRAVRWDDLAEDVEL
jgi:hypothetical protein